MFLFRTNPNLANLTLRGIYVLNAEGTRFDLQEADYVLKPFEAYITANAVTRSLVRSVGVCDGSVVTANEIATATAAVRIWAADGAACLFRGGRRAYRGTLRRTYRLRRLYRPRRYPLGFAFRYLHGSNQ